MVKSYWLRLFLFSAIFGALAFGISLLIPKKYEGIVQILIDQKAVQPNMPTSSVEQTVTDLIDFPRSRGIITQVQQLTSFAVLQRAITTTYAERGYPGEPSGDFDYFELINNIAIEAEVGSDLVTVRVRMGDPEDAKALARNLYLAFEEYNLETSRSLSAQAVQSLESQMNGVKAKLASLDQQTQEMRERLKAPNIDSQIQADIGTIARLKDTRETTLIDLASVEGRLRILRRNFAKVPKTLLVSSSDSYNSNLYSFDQNLATLRTDLAAMEERLLPEHEAVVAQKKKIREMEDERAKQLNRIDSNRVTSPNPLYQNLEAQIAEAEASVTALRDRLNSADQVLTQANQQLDQHPESQALLVDLARQQASLERTYASYADKLQSLEQSGSGRAAITRTAGAGGNPDPVSPKPVINMLIGMVIGLVLGVMSMLRTESSRQPIRSIMQLNLLSSEPVFRALPSMKTPFRGLTASPPEAFEALTAAGLRSKKRPYRVGVVGVVRDSGSSTTALNYALSVSRRGLDTVLVSLDPRSPTLRRLSTGKANEHLTVVEFEAQNLVVGSSGEIVFSEEITSVERDLTIFDFEASTDSADYAIAASGLDEVIVLVRANKVSSVDFLAVQQALRDAGCDAITVVLSRGTESDAMADAPDIDELRALPS